MSAVGSWLLVVGCWLLSDGCPSLNWCWRLLLSFISTSQNVPEMCQETKVRTNDRKKTLTHTHTDTQTQRAALNTKSNYMEKKKIQRQQCRSWSWRRVSNHPKRHKSLACCATARQLYDSITILSDCLPAYLSICLSVCLVCLPVCGIRAGSYSCFTSHFNYFRNRAPACCSSHVARRVLHFPSAVI